MRTLVIVVGFVLAGAAVGPLPAETLAGALRMLQLPADRALSAAHAIFLVAGAIWAFRVLRDRACRRARAAGADA